MFCMATGMKPLDTHACMCLCWLCVASYYCWTVLSSACCFSIVFVTGSVHVKYTHFKVPILARCWKVLLDPRLWKVHPHIQSHWKSRTLEALCPAWMSLVSPSFPLFSVCYCCWICPLFRWLVAMLLSSLCSLALWWIVYGFPSSILHFCIDGLGFEWVLQPVSPPKKPVLPPHSGALTENAVSETPVSFKFPNQIRNLFKNQHLVIVLVKAD